MNEVRHPESDIHRDTQDPGSHKWHSHDTREPAEQSFPQHLLGLHISLQASPRLRGEQPEGRGGRLCSEMPLDPESRGPEKLLSPKLFLQL